MKTTEEYFGIALELSEDRKQMCCLIQEGTGNTVETSNLVERYFPYRPMKDIITNKIDEDGYVRPQQFFKVIITQEDNCISCKFFNQEETEELKALFEKPNYFEGMDLSFKSGN
jgi:hypothetical protein